MNRNIIIKIAVGVSVVALLFSLVTLIRALIIGSNVVFPVIQVIGSAAIFAICFMLFRSLSAAVDDETEDADEEENKPEPEPETDKSTEQADEELDELYEKYHLSDFEEKEQ